MTTMKPGAVTARSGDPLPGECPICFAFDASSIDGLTPGATELIARLREVFLSGVVMGIMQGRCNAQKKYNRMLCATHAAFAREIAATIAAANGLPLRRLLEDFGLPVIHVEPH